VLSFRLTWETARPVAFDSLQLKATEKNYPTHKKELLAIVSALKKWRADLLGTHFYVYTDHRTLENFDKKHDLSRRQLCWQEFLSQYDCTITYIQGEDNVVADALSRLPPHAFPDEYSEEFNAPPQPSFSDAMLCSLTLATLTVNAVLGIHTDPNLIYTIKKGYHTDKFCK
jgi:RNase H-like domain found in reverse transcriptase